MLTVLTLGNMLAWLIVLGILGFVVGLCLNLWVLVTVGLLGVILGCVLVYVLGKRLGL